MKSAILLSLALGASAFTNVANSPARNVAMKESKAVRISHPAFLGGLRLSMFPLGPNTGSCSQEDTH